MKLRISRELFDRLQDYAGYVYVMTTTRMSAASIVSLALEEWAAEGMTECSICENNGFATTGGAVLTVRTDRPPREVQEIVNWYLLRHPVPAFETVERLVSNRLDLLKDESWSKVQKERRALEAQKALEDLLLEA